MPTTETKVRAPASTHLARNIITYAPSRVFPDQQQAARPKSQGSSSIAAPRAAFPNSSLLRAQLSRSSCEVMSLRHLKSESGTSTNITG